MTETKKVIAKVSLSAVITRADGTVEDLGIISEFEEQVPDPEIDTLDSEPLEDLI